ncbi:uncharacterized protein LOC130737747 isoform X1 [Lotus japonicus]|uniref:uncharacterized protein LOC130737747 isoform X1 n=1 Tax=Lotus japonicus TaxID=34305 RepID=UPI00258E79F9|nr:uncharacterized protein LOC130737747 isoform X1 [Lotus japonicus]
MSSRGGSSSSRGRGRNKEKRKGIIISDSLILSGPTAHQSGPTVQKSEPTAQNQSPQPKQTKADYALSIPTLLAFKQAGLDNVPQGLINLPNKSWANIADKDDDLDLQSLQSFIERTKSLATHDGKKPVVVTQSSPVAQSNPNSEYLTKTVSKFQTLIEPEWWDHSGGNLANKIGTKLFPGHLDPIHPNKTQRFYEFILVDTNSVDIKHFRDKNDNSLITHSTLQILRVLRPTDFGPNPNTYRKFSQNFDPIDFNYWDYIKAWEFTILGLQNKNFKHSWLIYFKWTNKYSFPIWFHSWWSFFGPTTEIFPPEVLEGYNLFLKHWNKEFNNYPDCLNFYTIFSLSWVFSWRYGLKTKPQPILNKHALIKWWKAFDASKAHKDKVIQWFKSNQKYLKHASPQTSLLLNQKAHITAALAGASTEEDLLRNLQSALQLLKEPIEQASSSKAPQHKISEQSSFGSDYAQTTESDDDDFC